MSSTDIRSTTEVLTGLIWKEDREGLTAYVDELPPADLNLIFSRLDSTDRSALLEILDPEDAAGLLLNLRELSPHALLSGVAPQAAAGILHELPSNIATDFIAAMKPGTAQRILALLPEREMDDVLALARYAPDVAGGLMVTEILSYPETATVQNVVDDFRLNAAVYADYNIQYIYVTRGDESLGGVLRIRDLLLSGDDTVLGDLIIEDPVTVNHLTPLQDLSDLLDRHRYLGLPVVDDEGRLVGVVRRAAVEEAIAQRTARQFRLVQGIIGGEEVRTMPVALRSGRRLAWLSANIVLNVIAASVIVYFEDTLDAI